MNKNTNRKKGFSLVEMMFYIGLLTILLLVVINLVLSAGSTYNNVKVSKNLDSSAVSSMEMMTRIIRGAINVNAARSVLNSDPGDLMLVTLNGSGATTTSEFKLGSGGTLQFYKGGIFQGPLTEAGTSAAHLVFRLATTTNSQAVKIEMTLNGVSGKISQSQKFYSTVVLRGSY